MSMLIFFAAMTVLPVIPQPREFVPSGDGSCIDVSTLVRKHCVFGKIDSSASLADEAYEMTLAMNGISYVAKTTRGLAWAKATLEQLAWSGQVVPCGTIRDRPACVYRGFLLDVARKPYSLAFLRDVVRNLAYYKMNVFHVHLNDTMVNDFSGDGEPQGAFRLESETEPKLTSKDLFYTKDEFRAFVKESANLGVEIIPEIDTPGHAASMVAARPHLARDGKVPGSNLDIANPETLAFVKSLFDEYCAGSDPVFAGPRVHIGTDEFGGHDAFRPYVDGLFRHLRSLGKQPCAWGSLDHAGGTAPVVSGTDIFMDIWHKPFYSAEHALRDGYSIVTVLDGPTYIVPGNAPGQYNDYLDVGRLYKGYKVHKGSLGGKFALWNDRVGNGITEDDSFDRLFPGIQVMAQKLWSPDVPHESIEDFRRIAAATHEAPGVNRAHRLTGPGGKPGPDDVCVGWVQNGGWTATFELKRTPYAAGITVLFDDGRSTVRILPSGELGFTCEKYDHAFDVALSSERWCKVKLCGTPKGVTLWVDGVKVGTTEGMCRCKVRTDKVLRWSRVRTLHFPLKQVVGTDVVRGFMIETGIK